MGLQLPQSSRSTVGSWPRGSWPRGSWSREDWGVRDRASRSPSLRLEGLWLSGLWLSGLRLSGLCVGFLGSDITWSERDRVTVGLEDRDLLANVGEIFLDCIEVLSACRQAQATFLLVRFDRGSRPVAFGGHRGPQRQGFVRFLLGFDHRKLGLQLLVVLEQKLVALGVHCALGGQLLAHFQADGVLGMRDDVRDQGACRQCDLHVAQGSKEVWIREF